MERLHAKAAGAEELPDLGCVVVVFVEQPAGGGWRIELQRSLEVDEQDRELGLDSYCVVTDDGEGAGGTRYGGVTGWSIEHNVLHLLLDADAARLLGVHEVLEVEFPAAQIVAVDEMLRRILVDVAVR